jgi:hypothetical protein
MLPFIPYMDPMGMCIIDYCTVLVIVMILIMIGDDDNGAPSDGQFQERLGYPKMIAALPAEATSGISCTWSLW